MHTHGAELRDQAVVVHQFGDPSVLTVESVPVPSPGPGQVLVEVCRMQYLLPPRNTLP